MVVARDAAALDAVADRARGRGVKVEALVADLGREHDLDRVAAVIRDADPMVDLLVNNAGIGHYSSFLDLPIDRAIEIVRVNDIALLRLTHAATSRMVESGRGSVVQVSSLAAASPGPYTAVYAASKTFVASFGQALAEELRPCGVSCTTVLPGFTRTNYFDRVGLRVDMPDRYWMTPTDVARAALDGARARRDLVIAGRRSRRTIALSVPFPSLLKGRIRHRASQAKRFVRRVVPRS
jgi:uncharacterized protein